MSSEDEVRAGMQPGRIPVNTAKRVATEHDLRQVLLIGYDGKQVHVVTYGRTKADCKQAATAQDFWTGHIREFSFNGPLDAARLAVVEAAKKKVNYNDHQHHLNLQRAVDALERIEKEADGGAG